MIGENVDAASVVSYAREGHCAVVTINRPDARNSVNPEVARGIEVAFDTAEADDDIWVVILTGSPPAFCAGADLKALAAGQAAELSTERGGFAGITRRERVKPLIAAVDGPALAGGTEIVLACDLVVASEDATFGIPEVKRGLLAAAGGLFRLAQKIPVNVAMECALTGDPLTASRAHHFGLVNELCPSGDALETARALALRITANAPLAVRHSRAVMVEGTRADDEAGWTRTAQAGQVVRASEDRQEGLQAFIEKRAPRWTGR